MHFQTVIDNEIVIIVIEPKIIPTIDIVYTLIVDSNVYYFHVTVPF